MFIVCITLHSNYYTVDFLIRVLKDVWDLWLSHLSFYFQYWPPYGSFWMLYEYMKLFSGMVCLYIIEVSSFLKPIKFKSNFLIRRFQVDSHETKLYICLEFRIRILNCLLDHKLLVESNKTCNISFGDKRLRIFEEMMKVA